MDLSALVAAVSVAATLVAPAVAPASLADPAEPAQYVRTAYDGTIWEVTDTSITSLSFAQWQSLGTPAYTPAHTTYVTVLSMPTVYARTDFGGGDIYDQPITAAQYRVVKSPKPAAVAWAQGIRLVKWQTSADLIATDPNGNTRKLTYAQWKAAGFPSPQANANRGFVQLSWDPAGGIAYMCDIRQGLGYRLTYDEWRSLGFPAPQRVTRTNRDNVFQRLSLHPAPTLYYVGPMTHRPSNDHSGLLTLSFFTLTNSQWRAMGSPAPQTSATMSSGAYDCGAQQKTPWE